VLVVKLLVQVLAVKLLVHELELMWLELVLAASFHVQLAHLFVLENK
jgi:hypothetical protein